MRVTATPKTIGASTITAAEILLRKRLKAIPPDPHDEGCPLAVVATAAKNVESLGFTFSRDLFEALRRSTTSHVEAFTASLTNNLRKMVGAHRRYVPMYPNFPSQVMEATQVELFMNAMAHYWGSFVSDIVGDPSLSILPRCDREAREPLGETSPLRLIALGTVSDFDAIFTNLLASNGSLSEVDRQTVVWFVENYGRDYARLLPPSIPQKENLATLVGAALSRNHAGPLTRYLKTATDVLRVAAAMSGGDVSLATPTVFRSFNRRERRFLLGALDQCHSATEDMLRWKERWKRLGEKLHPGEYAKRSPCAFEAFQVIRNDEPFVTFNGHFERAIKAGRLSEAVARLETRPGLFARRLDHLLRLGYGDGLVERFAAVAGKVSTPVLVQLHAHFKSRHADQGFRAFFPKGSVAKMQVSDTSLPPLPMDTTIAMAQLASKTLVERFRSLPPLGKVWVDPKLAQCTVPFAQRSASKSLRTISRGSRIDLTVADAYRFFLWWKNGNDRADIDLSAVFYGNRFDMISQVAYYNLREFGCCHSGDITTAPKGACEFIDVDVAAVRRKGVRYVALVLNSFTRQRYCDLPECFAGWMARTEAQSGEVFEARTVQDKIDLSANTTVCVPVVFDLVDHKAIWCDFSLTNRTFYNNVHSNRGNLAQMVQAAASIKKPNLYDLFSFHAKARGTPATLDEADTLFSLNEGVTPFDIDIILSQYLA